MCHLSHACSQLVYCHLAFCRHFYPGAMGTSTPLFLLPIDFYGLGGIVELIGIADWAGWGGQAPRPAVGILWSWTSATQLRLWPLSSSAIGALGEVAMTLSPILLFPTTMSCPLWLVSGPPRGRGDQDEGIRITPRPVPPPVPWECGLGTVSQLP